MIAAAHRSTNVLERYSGLIGESFGLLTFSKIAERRGDNNRVFGKFVCQCGNSTELPVSRVLSGSVRLHCGCMTDRGKSRTHGMKGSPEYSSWSAMKSRCLDKNCKDYPRWGGAGITIFQEWADSFEAFYAHIGPRPSGTSIDRIDTTKGYEPGNVRWATQREQCVNRINTWVVEINGVVFDSMADAARNHGVSETTIVRWCDGFQDKRRADHSNNGITPPKVGCRRYRKY